MNTQPEITAADYVNTLGIEYKAEFVPESQAKTDMGHGLHWNVTLKKGNQSLTTPYFQGVGHIPGYSPYDRSIDHAHMCNEACEKGTYFKVGVNMLPKKLQKPELTDVMYSLILDSSAIDYADFEDWAAEYGYDTDSRKAVSIYQDCVAIGLRLRAMFGDEVLSELRESFQDY